MGSSENEGIHEGPVGKIAELVTIPPAVTIVARFRNDRLPKVVIVVAFPPVQKRFVGEPIAIPDALEPVLMAAYVVPKAARLAWISTAYS
jgi:hypothetical protein